MAAFTGPAAIGGGKSAEEPDVVVLAAGTYQQQVTISQSNIDVVGGSSKYADTILTDDLNARTPRPGGSSSGGSSSGATTSVGSSSVGGTSGGGGSRGGTLSGTYGTTGASSTFVTGKNVVFANIEFANSTPLGGSQAVAIKTTGDGIAFVNCGFSSFQDTLYVTGGRDYFLNCFIAGNVDFIFGNATAVFEHCTINSLRHSGGGITAPNTRPGSANGLVFLDCTLSDVDKDADLGGGAMPAGSVYLGRPWQYQRNWCASIFINTKMDGHIRPEGWSPWDKKNSKPGGSTRFAEYNSMDVSGKALDVSKRASWSHQLSGEQVKQFTLANIFGAGSFWYGGGFGDSKSWPSFGGAVAGGEQYNNGGNPSSYSNPGWSESVGNAGVWNPEVQIETLILHATEILPSTR
jgi:pectin methylesterase-like acyl-CoA thioesterase